MAEQLGLFPSPPPAAVRIIYIDMREPLWCFLCGERPASRVLWQYCEVVGWPDQIRAVYPDAEPMGICVCRRCHEPHERRHEQ